MKLNVKEVKRAIAEVTALFPNMSRKQIWEAITETGVEITWETFKRVHSSIKHQSKGI